MTFNPQVAVVILNYFNHELTKSCCESIAEEMDVHFFIVENSAKYNEKDKLLKKIHPFQKQLTLLLPDENLGFAAGVNLGLRKAMAMGFERFFVINNDARLKNGCGFALQRAFSAHKGCLMSPTLYWDNKIMGGRFYHKYTGIMFNDNCHFLSNYGSILGFFFYLTGCAWAFDKTFLSATGLLDEDFFMYGEDVEYSWRTQRRGSDLVVLQDVIVEHDGSQSSRKHSSFYEYHINRGHFLLVSRLIENHFLRIVAFCTKVLAMLCRSLWRSIRYRTTGPFMAFWAAPLELKIRPRRK